MNIEITYYKKSNGTNPVKKFIEEYPIPIQARITRTIELLRDYGLQIGMPHLKPLTGVKGAWELRVKADKQLFRFGFIINDGKAIILHGFIKKSGKTERKELAIIKSRIKEIS